MLFRLRDATESGKIKSVITDTPTVLRFYHREEKRARKCSSDEVVLASGCRPEG